MKKKKIFKPWWQYVLAFFGGTALYCIASYHCIKESSYTYKNKIHSKIKFIEPATNCKFDKYYFDDNHYIGTYELNDKLKVGDSIVKNEENVYRFKVFRNDTLVIDYYDNFDSSCVIKCYRFFIPNF